MCCCRAFCHVQSNLFMMVKLFQFVNRSSCAQELRLLVSASCIPTAPLAQMVALLFLQVSVCFPQCDRLGAIGNRSALYTQGPL